MIGYIKLYRQLFENPDYFKNRFDEMRAWIDLLLLANDKDSTLKIGRTTITVKRGQIARSIQFFAERWRWSKHTVLSFLEEKEKMGILHHQKKFPISLIIIVDYKKYQGDFEETAPPSAPPLAPPSAPPSQTLHHQKKSSKDVIINDEEKNKEGENDGTAPPSAPPKRKKETNKDEKVSPTPLLKEEINKEEKEEKKANNKLLGGKSLRPPVTHPIEERKKWLVDSIKDANASCPRDMLNEFYLYWTETTPGGLKMRFELEKTWVTSLRLARWYKNNSDKKWR